MIAPLCSGAADKPDERFLATDNAGDVNYVHQQRIAKARSHRSGEDAQVHAVIYHASVLNLAIVKVWQHVDRRERIDRAIDIDADIFRGWIIEPEVKERVKFDGDRGWDARVPKPATRAADISGNSLNNKRDAVGTNLEPIGDAAGLLMRNEKSD